jgi:hypothetical protein
MKAYSNKPRRPSPAPASTAPSAYAELGRQLLAAGIAEPMAAWQMAGFTAGLICALGPAPELAFDPDEDPDRILAMDCLDELSRQVEDSEAAVAAEDLAESAAGKAALELFVGLVAETEAGLLAQGGHPVLAFAEAAAEAQDPALADVPAARAYARGLLRGLVMGVEDEDGLAAEHYGEALSLIFILTEDDLGPDFGSPAELAEARQSVAAALPGLVARLWTISHNDGEE